MTSWRCMTHLFLLVSLSMIDLSEEACKEYFSMKDWGRNLSETIFLVETKVAKDKMECTVERECIEGRNICHVLYHCFNRTDDVEETKKISERCEGNTSQSVPFYHFMCLTARAAGLTPAGCEYEAVCALYSEYATTTVSDPTTATKTTTTLSPTTTTPTTTLSPTSTAPSTLPERTTAMPSTTTTLSSTTTTPTTTLSPTSIAPSTLPERTTAVPSTTTTPTTPTTLPERTTAVPSTTTTLPPTTSTVTQSTVRRLTGAQGSVANQTTATTTTTTTLSPTTTTPSTLSPTSTAPSTLPERTTATASTTTTTLPPTTVTQSTASRLADNLKEEKTAFSGLMTFLALSVIGNVVLIVCLCHQSRQNSQPSTVVLLSNQAAPGAQPGCESITLRDLANEEEVETSHLMQMMHPTPRMCLCCHTLSTSEE